MIGFRGVLAGGIIACLTLAGAPLRAAENVPACAAATTTDIFNEISASIGFPESHKDDLDDAATEPVCPGQCPPLDPQPEEVPEVTLICHDRFCTQYNSVTKLPDWVIERLTPDIVTGTNKRPSTSFKRDKKLPPGSPSAANSDYTHSGFSRGHQAASADFKCSSEWMKQTFTFANAVPQIQDGFNGGIWRQLEDYTQNLAKERDEIYVITGPVEIADDGGETVIPESQNACGRRIVLAGLNKLAKSSICNANDDDPSKDCDSGVAVPAGLFKIIYVPETERAFGFLLSNEDHRILNEDGLKGKDYLEEWRTSITEIESASNLKFFTDLSMRESSVLKENCTETRWR